ncbi:MAG TPA: hypothetical protein VML75_12105 [Kofleriaceae bacterium]|nr:hypothetical protein [Kofleriaceae bacterium]
MSITTLLGRLRAAAFAALALVWVLGGCADDSKKSAGEECFGSAECADGLVCDVGSTPATCQPTLGDGDGDGDGD